MSKAHSRRRTGAVAQSVSPPAPASRPSPLAWTHQALVRVPRWSRILLAGIFAISLTAVLFPLVDYIYIMYFLTPETRIIPALISPGAGLLMYMAGWVLIVGTVGDSPAEQVRRHPVLLIYLVIGFSVTLLAIGLIIQGISMTDMVAG
jgi:hypothetical protein